jgi:hypothetical protein
MVKAKVVVNGKELLHNYISSSEVLVYGELKASVFFVNDCTDILYFVSPSEPSVDTVLFVGNKMRIVYKTSTVVVLTGDVERVEMVNSKGNVVKTYRLNENCENGLFTAIK